MVLSSSVQLARRVLQLERINSSLKKGLEAEEAKTARTQEEVTICIDMH